MDGLRENKKQKDFVLRIGSLVRQKGFIEKKKHKSKNCKKTEFSILNQICWKHVQS